MTLTERVRAFWSRVAIGYPDECWLWTGRIDTGGRGQFQWPEMSQGKRFISASRAAWILEFGPITADRMFVCHRCDVPRCCNPKHLFLGTAKQNTWDAIAKGRYRKGPPAPKGSKYNAKMTWDEVREIRRSRGYGLSLKQLVQRYPHLPKGRIEDIIYRLTWTDDPQEAV